MVSGMFSIPLDASQFVVRRSRRRDSGPPLNLREYIGGDENFLVQFAAECVVEGRAGYDPIVFFGQSATGKSLLANGLALLWKQHNAAAPMVAVAGAEFAREYGNAVQTDSMQDLRTKYRSTELLVIDDLDETAGKNGAQNELVVTLDALRKCGSHVLVTLKDSPTDSKALPAALASRLSSGLTVPLLPPGLAAGRAILKRLAVLNEVPIPDESIELLGKSLVSTGSSWPTVPQLNDAVLQLYQLSQHEQEPISLSLTARFLGLQNAACRPPLRSITKQVCRYFNLRSTELRGPTRQQRVVRARGVAMLLARQLTNKSLVQVGRHFGNRDHSTVLHACRKTQSLIQTDPAIRQAVEELTLQLSTL